MHLNLNDPLSIARWRNVSPERHDQQLRAMWKRLPQFREAIEASRALLDRPKETHAAAKT